MSSTGKETKCTYKWNGEQHAARDQRRHGDGNPHLLAFSFDRCEEFAVAFVATELGFIGDQTTEVGTLVGELQNGRKSTDAGNPRDRLPLPKCVLIGVTSTDIDEHAS